MATILLVDDRPTLRTALGGVLEDEGHTVLRAADNAEALALYAKHQGTIDLLLADRTQYGDFEAGFKLVKQLRDTGAQFPMIVQSDCAPSDIGPDRIRCRAAGGDAFIPKTNSAGILKAIDEQLGAHTPGRR